MRKLVLPIDVLANNLMGIGKGKTDYLLSLIREGKQMTLGQQLRLTAYLSVPAIMAQISSIAMQYIDASMVGSLGANAAASIGLVSTTTWLFWGVCAAAATGFSVQVAHRIGAGDFVEAKKILRQAVTATLVFSSLLAVGGICISGMLPLWLGGDEAIWNDSSLYFRIFALFLPALQLNFLAGGMLRCSGNMRVPAMLNIMMCLLDVVFNFFLIFPTRHVEWFGVVFTAPGAGLGVKGAILGTVLAELVTAGGMMWYLCRRSPMLKFVGERGSFLPKRETLRKSFRISLPMGFEHMAICGAQIATTVVVAPLGIVAIAANSFAIIAESLCYMPGYGISTPEAFAAYDKVGSSVHPDCAAQEAAIRAGDLDAVCAAAGNALEECSGAKDNEAIKAALRENGAVTALMTGSGAAVFGVFRTEAEAKAAADALRARWPQVYTAQPVRGGAALSVTPKA